MNRENTYRWWLITGYRDESKIEKLFGRVLVLGWVKENHPLLWNSVSMRRGLCATAEYISYSSCPILSILRLCLTSIFLWFAIERRISSRNDGKNLCFVKGECHGNEPVSIEIILNVKGKFTFFHFCIRFIDSDYERWKVQFNDWISYMRIWEEVIIV